MKRCDSSLIPSGNFNVYRTLYGVWFVFNIKKWKNTCFTSIRLQVYAYWIKYTSKVCVFSYKFAGAARSGDKQMAFIFFNVYFFFNVTENSASDTERGTGASFPPHLLRA